MTIARWSAPVAVLLLVIANAWAQQTAPAPPGPDPSGVQPAAQAPPAAPIGDVERGRYIVEDVAMCVECHSSRDSQGNILASERFMGGPIPFNPPWPNDWAIRAPRNRGLPGYTDELGIRLLTQGAIDRFGNQLRAPMPRYRMSPQDAADVVAYMKSLP